MIIEPVVAGCDTAAADGRPLAICAVGAAPDCLAANASASPATLLIPCAGAGGAAITLWGVSSTRATADAGCATSGIAATVSLVRPEAIDDFSWLHERASNPTAPIAMATVAVRRMTRGL